MSPVSRALTGEHLLIELTHPGVVISDRAKNVPASSARASRKPSSTFSPDATSSP